MRWVGLSELGYWVIGPFGSLSHLGSCNDCLQPLSRLRCRAPLHKLRAKVLPSTNRSLAWWEAEGGQRAAAVFDALSKEQQEMFVSKAEMLCKDWVEKDKKKKGKK